MGMTSYFKPSFPRRRESSLPSLTETQPWIPIFMGMTSCVLPVIPAQAEIHPAAFCIDSALDSHFHENDGRRYVPEGKGNRTKVL